MRRCVILAVLLSLVVSLPKAKGSGSATSQTATTPITSTANGTVTTPAPPETTPTTTTANGTVTTPAPPETTPTTTTANGTVTTPAPPETTPTTTTANGTVTTPAPPETTPTTTTANGTVTTPAPPETTPTTTTANGTVTTPAPPETTPTTTTANGTVTTPAPPETTPTTTTANGTVTTPAPPETTPTTTTGNVCKPDSCGINMARCVALYSTITCQCSYGFYYFDKDCHRGDIFPGVITLAFYSNSVPSVDSVQYEEVFQNITDFFKHAFKSLTSFRQTVIVEIQPVKEDRSSFPMSVTVINLFMENSGVENKTVISAITEAEKNSSYVSQYRATTYCAAFNCDVNTTYCEESMFPKCMCKDGYAKTAWDDRSCSDCNTNCSKEENEYCTKEEGVPMCKCLPNFEKKNATCVSCPVGYSGENCNNNSELILIIVGTVFGAIILCLVIAVSIVSVRAKHKQDPEKRSLIKSGYSNSNTSDDRQPSMFPRVQTTSGHANPGYQPNNPYEMHSSNRGHFLEQDYDDLYEISREPAGFRMQKRY